MNNWFDYILFHARLQPEKPAMAMENRVVTYAMLKTAIDRCASRLVAADIGSGFVAVLVKNPIRHMALCLALYRIGVPSISLEHQQADIGGETFSAVIGDRDSQHLIDSRNRFVEAADEWFSQDPPDARALPPAFSDDGAICRASLTSGTTGTPKRVSYSSTEIGERILIFLDVNWSLVLCMPGLSSNIGFKTACAALATGRTLCFAESPFQAIRMIELFSIDLVLASPEQVLALTRVARRTRAQVNSLRRLEIVGNRSTRNLLEAATMYLCKDIQCRYATSETGVLARTWGREVLANPGLAGEVLPGVEVGIFNDNGDRCDPGDIGIVKCRVTTRTAAGTPTGGQSWIDLGDVGCFGKDGRLYIFGRAADSAGAPGRISGAASPVDEVEHLLRLAWDVTDAAAILIEQAETEAQIWVGVVDGHGITQETLAAVMRQGRIDYPVRLFAVQFIPRGANGKVSRQKLKAMLLELSGTPSRA